MDAASDEANRDTPDPALPDETAPGGVEDGVAETDASATIDGTLPAVSAPGAGDSVPQRFLRLRQLLTMRRVAALAGVAAVLLLIGGASFALTGETGPSVTIELEGPGQYRELPKLVTDLRPSGSRKHFVSVAMVVELGTDELDRLDDKETEVMDALQALLRDYDREDLAGRDGAQRVRADALHVINRILAPVQARSLLFKEFLVD